MGQRQYLEEVQQHGVGGVGVAVVAAVLAVSRRRRQPVQTYTIHAIKYHVYGEGVLGCVGGRYCESVMLGCDDSCVARSKGCVHVCVYVDGRRGGTVPSEEAEASGPPEPPDLRLIRRFIGGCIMRWPFDASPTPTPPTPPPSTNADSDWPRSRLALPSPCPSPWPDPVPLPPPRLS